MDMQVISLKHEELISSYVRKHNDKEFDEILSVVYRFVRSITNMYYKDGLLESEFFKNILIAVDNVENRTKYKNSRIIDNEIYFEKHKENDNFLDFLIYNVRTYIFDKIKSFGIDLAIENIDLSNYCVEASVFIKKLCEKNNITCHLLKISPGYDETAYLYNGHGYHYANIVLYNGKYYLMDSTISQFFYTKRNNLDRLGLIETPGCDMGIFLLMSDLGKVIATELLKYGYIELNEEILKTYLDAFSISFRNGLYYEFTNDFSYTTNYTVDDYIKFLKGEDNQVNYEGKDNLGYLKRPLKKWDLDFRRR